MDAIVHARLDARTLRLLRRLKRRHGWNESEIVRRGIAALSEAALRTEVGARRIFGVAQFASGIDDLAHDKRRLRDFGRR